MLIRLMIGWVQMFETPGSVAAMSSSAMIFSRVMPGRHWLSGLRLTIVSVMLSGAGSVEVSARETFATTSATSGSRAIAAFCIRVISIAWGSEIAGSVIGMNIRSPSLSGGMNSLPIRGTSAIAPASTTTAAPSVRTRCRSAQPSNGRYSQTRGRMTGFRSSPRTFPPIRSVQSTGTRVTARIVAPTMAKVLVKASGRKSLPSWPVRAKTGMKARMMMAMEKKIGRPTRRVASSTVCRQAARSRRSTPALLDEAEGVLRDDDGRVHEDADGDGDAGQRHDVRRDAEVAHEEEGREHRERNRDRDDQHRAQVKEEEEVHERDDDGLLDQGAPERSAARSIRLDRS